ncbi:MAG TPA: HEAT repeat domain-containing protein, partial [Gemmatimonadaceae bacterium]|nr:HEAT repeat domain-containing protein [Gemmatimonadaceae bacterium]
MKAFHIVVALAVVTVGVDARSAHASPIPMPQAQQADPADSLYRRARSALDDKNYDVAARLFDSILSRYPKSVYAPDALYWKGFALYRSGDLTGAALALDTQANLYPNAPTRADAGPLLIVVKGELAKRGDVVARREVDSAASTGGACQDMEVRTAALDALQQMDADRVLPLLRKVLLRRDDCSAPLRKNALFILAQKGGTEREKILLDVARSDPSTAVKNDAVFYLGQSNSDAAIDALQDVVQHGDELAVRNNALFALGQIKGDRTRKILAQVIADGTEPLE